MAGEAKEKCAVAAIVSNNSEIQASTLGHEVLFALQHRGTEASGMVSMTEGHQMHTHRENGMVPDVYNARAIAKLAGTAIIGHNRYSTNGSKHDHPQPFVDPAIGFAFAHNGNLPITDRLEDHLQADSIKTSQVNDSEMMGLAIAQNIRSGDDLPDAIRRAYPLFRGAFSCVSMHDGVVVAFRDRMGIRPLALGSFDGGYVVSSETCGLDIIDAKYEREVLPGEMTIITPGGIESEQITEGEAKLDMFEFVYFARHDSLLYGQRVNEVRRKFGEQLAAQHPPITDNLDNIVVLPVPDTSVPAAEGYAETLGLTQRAGIIKNRYIGRTFMQPTPHMRDTQLKRKHNIIPEVVTGKDVVIIDDSIVRLNTMPRLVRQAYLLGAKSVAVLIASPPVRFPDYYGIDTPKQSELAAANLRVKEIGQHIGCDYLGYLSMANMLLATGLTANDFNLSCFTGDYPIGIGRRKLEISAPISMEYAE